MTDLNQSTTGVPHRHLASTTAAFELPGQRSAFAADFRAAFRKGVEGIIQAERVLIEAKEALPRGEFTDWVEQNLKIATRGGGNAPR